MGRVTEVSSCQKNDGRNNLGSKTQYVSRSKELPTLAHLHISYMSFYHPGFTETHADAAPRVAMGAAGDHGVRDVGGSKVQSSTAAAGRGCLAGSSRSVRNLDRPPAHHCFATCL